MENLQPNYSIEEANIQVAGVKKTAEEWGLNIDPKLQGFFGREPERIAKLEKQIIDEGCRNPIVVWFETNTIADGYTRHDICQRHDIKFSVYYMSFEATSTVMEWQLMEQENRRNMTTPELIEKAHEIEDVKREEARKRQATSTGGANPQLMENFPEAEHGTSRDQLGVMAGVSGKTYAKGTHILENAPELIKNAWRREELSTDTAYKATILPDEKKQEVVDRIARGEKPKQAALDVINRDKPQESEAKNVEAAVVYPKVTKPKKNTGYSAADRELYRIIGEAYKPMLDESAQSIYTVEDMADEIAANGFDFVNYLNGEMERRKDLLKGDVEREAIRKAIENIISEIRKVCGRL